jgi:hypothetical protein
LNDAADPLRRAFQRNPVLWLYQPVPKEGIMATENTPVTAAQDTTKSAPATPGSAKPVGDPKPAQTPEKKTEPARK